MKHRISVIIPMWNEFDHIEKLILHLKEYSTAENIEEIIIVDGGSTDGSPKLVSSFEEVILLESSKGRARQLNFGALHAKGTVLYFLHADTFPPRDFDKKILLEIEADNTGSFRLQFDHPYHFLLKIASWFTRFNGLWFRGGDQSLFLTKSKYENLRGFDERYTIYEDVEFIKRIIKKFNFKIINDYVTTSSRKFKKNGAWRLFFHFAIIHIKNYLGASPEDLHKYYVDYIQL